ncbi:hypothetical protein AB833_25250 [Chromatiales bacterium (ex Bugula neritina AB1)]|nr:hypothetical protein AB833_25250 [Chromatiales bacterium (ex Bugula neritina AB1)]
MKFWLQLRSMPFFLTSAAVKPLKVSLPRALLLTMSLLGLGVASSALAQDFSDRTADHISGLSNDSAVKATDLGDFDGDGVEDIIISRSGRSPVLLMNEGGVLVNRTGDFMPNASAASNSNYGEAFDANNDGFTDIVFGRRGDSPYLFMNLGNDNNGEWQGFDSGGGLSGASNILVIESGDVTGDGAADLFIIQAEQASNRLLVNDGNGNFTDESSRLGPLAGGGHRRGHQALLDDVEGDGDVDIVYIESDLILYVYYNDGSGNFSSGRRSQFRNPDNFAYVFGAADFNGDGIYDYRQYSNPAPLAEMSTGEFDANGIPLYTVRQDAAMLRGNRKHSWSHMRDIDGDGDIDYVLSSMMRNFGGFSTSSEGHRTEVVLNMGGDQGGTLGTFTTFVAPAWANADSWDARIVDINGDGNMDMFIAHRNRYSVYINDAPPRVVDIVSVSAPPVAAGSQTSFTVDLRSVNDVTYEWDFGDGAPKETTSSDTITHTYADPGRYQATVTATDDQGSTQETVYIRVHDALENTKPVSSMDIVYEERDDGDRVYVVNPDNDSVTVILAATGNVLAEIPVGDDPRSLALDSPGILCVVNKGEATVSRVDTNNLAVVGSLQLPRASRPHGMVFDASKQFAYIALEATGKVLKVNFATSQIVGEVDVDSSPRELGLSADGSSLYAPRFISLPAASESTRTPAASGGQVVVINPADMTINRTIDLPYNEPASDIDTEIEARGIPNYLRSPAMSPSGFYAVIPTKVDNIYRGSMRDGNRREHDMLVRGMLSRLDLNTNSEQTARRFHFDNLSHPVAVAFGPTGNYLFSAHEGSRTVKVIDFYSNSIVSSVEVGFAPQGLVVSPDGNRVYVHNYLSRSVSMIDASELMGTTGGNLNLIGTVSTVSDEALNATVLLGKRLFHDSKDTRLASQEYISCAACHDDAGHDGRVWDFSDAGEGLRNTIDLRGRAGTGQGNVHWSANFDEFHDFENDIREIFDGTGLLTDTDFTDSSAPLDSSTPKAGRSSDLDALAAYAATLTTFHSSPFRNASGNLTSAGLRGKEIFRTADCALCHSGTAFTDSPSAVGHNIGTVDGDTGGRLGQVLLDGGHDTPTLRGLWHGAPYLHDGSALTVQQAVLAHTSGMNFDVQSLSSNELDDLASYLLQIDGSEAAASSINDFDGDGISDDVDPDDDNDGVEDINDAFPYDPLESGDSDGDGIGDNSDPQPNVPNETTNPPTTPTNTAPSNPNNSILVDGNFLDWNGIPAYASDANDVSGAGNVLDFATVWLAHDDDNLHVRYDNHAPDAAQFSWGYSLQLDTDSNPATGFKGFSSELPIGVDYMIEGSTLHRYSGTGNDFTWEPGVSLVAALGPNSLEMHVPRDSIGNPTSLRLFLFADNEAVNGTAVDFYPDAAGNTTAPLADRSFEYYLGTEAVTPEPEGPATPSPSLPPQVIYNPATITVDGNLADWSSLDSFGADADDASGTGNTIDWREGWMAHDAANFYIGWRNDEAAVISWGNGIMLDTDQNPGTGFKGFDSELSIGVDYLLEDRVIHRYTGGGNNWEWIEAGAMDPKISGTGTEQQISRAVLGNPTAINLFFAGNNEAVGGTVTDYYPDKASNTAASLADRSFTYSTVPPTTTPTPPTTPTPVTIALDGSIAEWPTDSVLGGEDANDVSGLNTIDWRSFRVLDDSNNLYMAYESWEPVTDSWGYGIYIDTDQNPATGFKGFDSELSVGAEYLLEGIDLNRYTGSTQNQWSWQSAGLMTVAIAGNIGELSIPRSVIGSPAEVDLLLRGDNTAVNGDVIDYHPNTGNTLGKLSYRLSTVQNDEPVMQAAESGGGGNGGGPFGLWSLIGLLLLSGYRKLWRVQLLLRFVLVGSALVLTACGGGGGSVTTTSPTDPVDNSNGGNNPATPTVPSNNPSFVASSVSNGPSSNASFALTIASALDGTQTIPPVATRAAGSTSIALNSVTGELTGQVTHTVNDATGAVIREGGSGQSGAIIVALVEIDTNTYAVPENTVLTAAQIAAFNAGQTYVTVQSVANPDGEIRSQLSNEKPTLTVAGSLDDIQAKVFSPVCSGCHTGSGSTLPGIMNLASSEGSYNSLVNTPSLNEPELNRVTPGEPDNSLIIQKLEGTHRVGSQMPFRGKPLDTATVDAIREWISSGASQ